VRWPGDQTSGPAVPGSPSQAPARTGRTLRRSVQYLMSALPGAASWAPTDRPQDQGPPPEEARILDWLVEEFEGGNDTDFTFDRIALQRLKEAEEKAKKGPPPPP
jgi:hypothetical protein